LGEIEEGGGKPWKRGKEAKRISPVEEEGIRMRARFNLGKRKEKKEKEEKRLTEGKREKPFSVLYGKKRERSIQDKCCFGQRKVARGGGEKSGRGEKSMGNS